MVSESMVSESIDLSQTCPTSTRNPPSDVYRLKRKLVWLIGLIVAAVLIVLLVLTIYFGVNQRRTNSEQFASDRSTTTKAPTETTTALAPPVERVPMNLKQQSYQLIIAPNLTSETFTG